MSSQVSFETYAKTERYRGNLEIEPKLPKVLRGNVEVNSEIGVILPTYCEAANIEKLVTELEDLNLSLSIMVIDDSSPDETSNIVRTLQMKYDNILLFLRPRKCGLGTAITDGIKAFLSLKNPPKFVITMDADYSHNPRDIPRLVNLARNGYDLVIGSRYLPGGKTTKWSPVRIMISKVANTFASVIIGAKIRDCTSGLRCYSLGLLRKVIGELHCQTYEIQIETIRQTVKKGCSITEMPITFTNRKLGKSKLSLNEVRQFVSYIGKASLEDYFEISKRLHAGEREPSDEILIDFFRVRSSQG
jgi:glycosyltransferase involved in cell wall biosynthesis